MGYELTFHTYIITNAKSGTLYIGHTDDINTRMQQHIDGHYAGFSKQYGLKHLVWFELFGSRDAAFKRERRMNGWARQWKINAIESMNPNWLDLHTVPVWPLPDKTLFPGLYAQCLEHRVDPGLRRDEQR